MIYPKENWLTNDEHGIQMPWYTRPCLEVIDRWDFKDKVIFEYGVGYSTLWYKSRGAYVYGVDSNLEWSKFAGAMYIHSPHYSQAITVLSTEYDVVIIDGSYRDDCTEYALKHLKPGGKLILDNWLQPEVEEFWPKTEALIKGMPIEIYKEPDHANWQTAIVTV
jgi:predicted O-methyltransferase YrrM